MLHYSLFAPVGYPNKGPQFNPTLVFNEIYKEGNILKDMYTKISEQLSFLQVISYHLSSEKPYRFSLGGS
jgi:hypothetical protein